MHHQGGENVSTGQVKAVKHGHKTKRNDSNAVNQLHVMEFITDAF